MTVDTAAILLAAAIAFLIPLAGYALHLHLEAKRQAGLAKEAQEKELQQARSNLLESLEILARAVQDEQVNPTEGCLRIRVLLDLLDEGGHVLRKDLVVFDEVHQKARHLATHQAREDLPREEKEKQDQERRALEEQYEAQIKEGAKALRQFCLDQGVKPSDALFVNAAAAGKKA
ncbi:Protein of unknown function [Marinospirillum celere]|uniref:DUF2489 domain-containing protein n=1 Tax=Marinospirillum celere TaxID=1122252 RepID=A0A1I1GJ98_9GAMM|nr:DUF2489 domain-containing protein [Marinospirillum celere]SFC11857.1 Protein of unknown function [Marinospirillum celere]